MYRLFLVFILALSSFAQSPAETKSADQKPAEHKMSAAEAEALFKQVDEMVAFASKSSGLPMHTPVKRKLISRDEVEQFITKRLDEDEDSKRIERSELVLKKFGLLPREFKMRAFAIKLLREQVAGFYDPKEKTINLLDWLDADAQRPVLVHELTHALQDQQIDLQKWLKDADALDGKDPFNKGVRSDEASMARSSVSEGQAMIVLFDYLLAPHGRKTVDVPGFVDLMRAQLAEQKDSGAMKEAPMILRESLVFPYVEGTSFEYEILKDGGKRSAFADTLKDPPVNSREIITPTEYIRGDKQPDPRMPDLAPILKGKYVKYDSGAVGQFDTQMLLKQFNVKNADSIAAGWRGGMYYAGKTTARDPQTPEDIALLYVSYWENNAAAQNFENIYRSLSARRYPSAKGSASEWVRVTSSGNMVIVSEGFDDATAVALEKAALNPATPKVALDQHTFSGSLSHWAAMLHLLRWRPELVWERAPRLLCASAAC
jgi:hypothetical protein